MENNSSKKKSTKGYRVLHTTINGREGRVGGINKRGPSRERRIAKKKMLNMEQKNMCRSLGGRAWGWC